MVALDLVAAAIQAMAAAMVVPGRATPEAGLEAIMVMEATEIKVVLAVVLAVAVPTQAPMAIPAVEAQDLMDKDLVAPMPPTVADKAAVEVKAVVEVKILGSVTATDRLTAATMAVVQVKVATAAALADTRCIEVVEDVFVSSGEQEEAFLQQAQEICNVTIING
jgi:hypothetical protein